MRGLSNAHSTVGLVMEGGSIHQRRIATTDQTASTSPNGQAP